MLLKSAGLLFTLIAVSGFCSSCVAPPQGLPTVERVEQEDIPVPAAFELRSSYAPDWKLAAGVEKARSWTGTYAGLTQVGEVAPWYVTEMQKNNWRLARVEERAEHDKVLCFDKGNESSTVHLYREISSKVGGYITVVKARISPRGPEEFSVDENLRWRDGEADIQPASFRSEAATQQPATPAGNPGKVVGEAPAPGSAAKAPAPPSDAAREIEEFEASAAH